MTELCASESEEISCSPRCYLERVYSQPFICYHYTLLTLPLLQIPISSLLQHHGQPRHLGEWEWTNFAVVTGCVLICAAYLYRADSNPNSWARDEAEARRRRRADGKDVVFGVNYAGIELLKNSGAVTVSEAEELEAGKIIVATGSSLSSNKST